MTPFSTKFLKLAHILCVPSWSWALLRHRVAAGAEHSTMFRHLSDLSDILDVGANRGQFALAARTFFPEARIRSFEPLEGPAQIFRQVFSSDPLVTLHQIAVGPEEGSLIIHVSRADDSSSLLPISRLQVKLFPGTEEKSLQTVAVKPLDAILTTRDVFRPALLKIDVQGFEREVLKGSLSLLSCFSYVYVECSFMELYEGQALAHEIISFLNGFGFILSGIYNLSHDKNGRALQGDFLFSQRLERVVRKP